MGRRGPAPEPTALKKLRGNPGRRPLNREEPAAPAGSPRCPRWLGAEAKSAWRQLTPLLQQMGVLSLVDAHALARYCALWARWRRVEQFIEQHGEVFPIKDEEGRVRYLQQFPQVGVANKLATQLTRLEQEFGMTPSARTRIRVETEREPDDLELFIASKPGPPGRR